MIRKPIELIIVFILLVGYLVGCKHIVPAPVRKMPTIKVLHNKKIEQLPLERYVALVLAGEVDSSWPPEALKAQAIASRTFALKRMQERKNNTYHVQNSVMDQVFRQNSHEAFTKAVKDSAGLVLTVHNELAETSFHSTCGGKTADAKTVWGRSYPHLLSNDCGYCALSPTYTWKTEFVVTELEAKFGQKISKIKILSRSRDDRVDLIELSGSKKQSISGHEFRMALGPMKVKSTLINEIVLIKDKVKINGHGFGHGVGLCQYGALGMAKAGRGFKEILTHYYPGSSIKRLY